MNKIKKEKGYQKIGATGCAVLAQARIEYYILISFSFRYCFGGSLTIRLGSTDLFDALVVSHPGVLTVNEIKAMKKPTSWVCAEGEYQRRAFPSPVVHAYSEDMTFKKPLRDQAEAIFAARKDKPDFVEYEFVDYKGQWSIFVTRKLFLSLRTQERAMASRRVPIWGFLRSTRHTMLRWSRRLLGYLSIYSDRLDD